MNKIITINLGGIAIQIEENAYDELRDYLKRLQDHFRGTENSEEIMADIENRIAEMLYEKLKVGKVSINLSDVNEVAKSMGTPSELQNEDEGSEKSGPEAGPHKRIKRLFRDPDDRKVGGVCSGIAKYLNTDVTIVRVLWVAAFFVFGTGLLIYFLLWAILPEAKTAAEKLEMMGEVPNVENIKNTIRDEANQAYSKIKETAESGSVQRAFDNVLSFFVSLVKAFSKVFAIMILVVIFVAIIVSFFRFFGNGNWFNFGDLDLNYRELSTGISGSGIFWFFKISWFLVIVIPLIYILVRIFTGLMDAPKPSRIVKQGVLSIWLLTLFAGIGAFVYGLNQFKEDATSVEQKVMSFEDDTIHISVSDFIIEGLYKRDQRIKLDVVPMLEEQAYLEIKKTVRGKNQSETEKGIASISDGYRISGKNLFFHEFVLFKDKSAAKMPELSYTLHVPQGKFIYFHPNTKDIIYHVNNVQNIQDYNMAGKLFSVGSSGLSCIDCPDHLSENSSLPQSQDVIERIDISDAIRVEIIEDGTNKIVYPKEKKWRESLEVELNNNHLSLSKNNDLSVVMDWFKQDPELKVEIHTSGLKRLEVDGASKVVYRANSATNKEYFSVSANGANQLEINDLSASKISVDLAGANSLQIGGSSNIFLLESDGASTLNAFDMKARSIHVNVAGAAVCKVYASDKITGNVDGTSKLKHRGGAKVSVKSRGVSVVDSDE